MRLRSAALAILVTLLSLSAPPPARAAFHAMKVVEVFTGTAASPNARYIVIQMWAAGQTFVAGHNMIVYDATGAVVGTHPFLTNVANGANQDTILVATVEAQTFFGVTADLTIPANAAAAGGKVCFDSSPIDCVAWGNYTGTSSFVGRPVAPRGIPAGRAIVRRLDISGSPTILDFSDDTDDCANDWTVSSTPRPRNNARVVGAAPPATCGDGLIGGLEQCDDSNTRSGDGCSSLCEREVCGDAFLAVGEVCDDGNTVSGDGCDSNCTLTGCGNAIVTSGEICDDGNTTSGDGCDVNCRPTGCGNGVLTSGEICDDGNAVSGDGCDSNCTVTACGNGILTSAEVCDDGNAVSGDGCDSNCTATACGNGILTGTETCDDGNATSGDGCDSNCTPTGCGNGIVTAGEDCEPPGSAGCDASCQMGCVTAADCDDGSPCTTNDRCALGACLVDPTPTDDGEPCTTDGCDPSGVFHDPLADGTMCDLGGPRAVCVAGICTTSSCGDGFVDGPAGGGSEECDDGNTVATDACTDACLDAECGDGIVEDGVETCDDGNTVATDACTDVCADAACGDGIVEDGAEACDDGNTVATDACTDVCADAACGDGIVQAGEEECDDGNTVATDACTDVCDVAICGDGIVADDVESCDDGPLNGTPGHCPADCGDPRPVDAGTDAASVDGGPRDAGPRDGGSIDGGTAAPPATGGCACRTGRAPASGLGAALVVLFGLLVRRRRT